MAEAARPRVSNVTKFFVPGLAVGLLVGGLGGAYLAPMFENSTVPEFKPKGPLPQSPPRQVERPLEPAPTAAPPTGPTGAPPSGAEPGTGQSGPTSSTGAPK